MTLAAVTLPIDRQRGVAAAWHYARALQLDIASTQLRARGLHTRCVFIDAARDEHARTARGYLGAVGFEARSRL